MALSFRDFTPRQMAPARRGSPAQWEPMTGVVQRVNQWLDAAGVRVVNVETLLLPLGKGAQPVSSSAGSVERWDEDHVWVQVVRVWHEVAVPPGAPINSPPPLGGQVL